MGTVSISLCVGYIAFEHWIIVMHGRILTHRKVVGESFWTETWDGVGNGRG